MCSGAQGRKRCPESVLRSCVVIRFPADMRVIENNWMGKGERHTMRKGSSSDFKLVGTVT